MPISKSQIAAYLDGKGIKHALQGFDYLITAISLCAENPDYKRAICQLYSEVAKTHGTTWIRAERNMRHAIGEGKAKLGEFIAVAADYFRYAAKDPSCSNTASQAEK